MDSAIIRERRVEVAVKHRVLVMAALVAIAGLGLRGGKAADACSSSSEIVAISERHPDLPLSPYVAGHLGVLQPTFARMHLVVAYAWLSGKGLDPAAQGAVLDLATRRLPWVPATTVVPTPPASTSTPSPAVADPVADWQKERTRVLGAPVAPPSSGYVTPTYLTIDNCLEDAFRVARDTLLAREATLGARAPELVAWVSAQDMVFTNCADPAKKAVPATLPASASAAARADRDYQIASAYFYSNRFDEAQKRYAAIAADKASPWSALAGYVNVRVRVRRANVGKDVADKAELGRALAAASSELADPSHATMHASLRRYRRYVRVSAEPQALLAETARALEGGGQGAETGPLLEDYTVLVDKDESVLEKRSDDLTAFVGAMQGKRTFDAAYARFQSSAPGSEAWLVAALTLATNAADPRVDTLLGRALAVAPSSSAYATARFHAIRLTAARGASAATLADLFTKTRTGLGSYVGLSTKNAFAMLAARTARDLGTFLREAPIVPAGASADSGPVVFDPHAVRAIPDELTDAISAGFPLSRLLEASLSTALPRDVRAHFAATTWARANLLGDRATAAKVAATVTQTNPALRTYVDRVENARTEEERRLALVHTLLTFPNVGPVLDAWHAGGAAPATLSSSSDAYFFCPANRPTTNALPAFLATTERDAAKKENAALTKLGAGSTWLALEATRAAKALPKDARSPEVLHLAVRATRFGCKDAKTSDASRAAFQLLHRAYGASSWSKATPYYY